MSKELMIAQRSLAPAQLKALQGSLETFRKLCAEMNQAFGENNTYNDRDLARYRAAADELPALRARWAAVDRPAGASFVAAEIAKLVIMFSNSTGGDPDLFSQVMADEVVASEPTYFELATAASACLRKYRFLSYSDLVSELERAKRRGEKLRYLFSEFPLAERVKQLEADLPRMRALNQENKRRDTEERRWRKVRKFIWRYLERRGRLNEYDCILYEMPDLRDV
jgi:hypothetical protein